MAFQIKDFTSIAASMINYAKATQDRLTDFTKGSAIRTVFECAAIEMDELYQQMWLGLKEAIPVALFQAFSFTPLPATSAQGLVSVTLAGGTAFTIPAGTRFVVTASPSQVFVANADVTVEAGQTSATVAVSALTVGVVAPVTFNTPFTTAIPGLVTAVAQADFSLGTAVETDAQRSQRFLAYIQSLDRSTNVALEYAAKTVQLTHADGSTEAVLYARVVDLVDASNTSVQADCYIHNGADGASPELLALCATILTGYTDPATGALVPGWKAAGVKLTVQATVNAPVDVGLQLTVAANADPVATQAAVRAAILGYF